MEAQALALAVKTEADFELGEGILKCFFQGFFSILNLASSNITHKRFNLRKSDFSRFLFRPLGLLAKAR